MAGHEIICGGFRIGRQIGVGGQALVCEAVCVEDRRGLVPVGSSVALKVAKIPLPADQPAYEDEQTWDRIRRRVAELKRLDHPNVVRYYGCFSEIVDLGGMDGVCRVHVIVMELLKGTNLKDWLSRYEHNGKPTGLDADDALSVIRGAVAGLCYTSRFGLVHRDIKPANIFVCEDGTVKIIDFGLAAQENVTQSTNVGGLKGTLNYMAPEFTEADFRGDETSDVFSMGVVMHQLITGNLPYDALTGKDGGETLVSYFSRWMSVKNGGPSPVLVWPIISRLLTGIAPVIEKALSPAREARYAMFAELEKALEKVGYCEVENGRRRYRYLRMVGKGGFGEVFKARDLSTGSLVAVKRLFNMSSAVRFEREAKTLKLLQDQDRCFVRFVDFFVRAGSGVSEGEAFLVMEYLDGMPGNSLREAIKAAARTTPPGTLDKLAVLLVFERYARGLAVMHRNGIIHRDIKPSNLYFANGRPESAVIMDFGIVRDLNAESTTGNVPCTLDYAPPEIILDEKERGHAGMDIYALGHCLYEALTGKLGYARLPAGIPGYTQFIQRVHNKERPKFTDASVRQDRKLMELIVAMTELDPVKRLSSADVVAQALREIIDGIEHLGDVTIPLDREAVRKMWEKHHPIDEPIPIPIPIPKPIEDIQKPRRWIWLSLLGLVAVCAAYFGPTHGPQLLDALQSRLPGPVLTAQDEDGKPSAPVPISLPTNPHPIPVVVVTNRLVVTNVVPQPQPAPVVITNVIDKPAMPPPVPPPPPAPPPEVKVRVTVPSLEQGVKCYFNGGSKKSGESFEVRAGSYEAVYSRMGYKTQEVSFTAREKDKELVLPLPGEWMAEPVSVSLPSLDEDVTCSVDGKAFSSGQGLLPGRHKYTYVRMDYLPQEGEFLVSAGVERSVPAPREWRPAPVEVRVSALGEGVKCEVDGRTALSGAVLKMTPGLYRYEYSRRAYRTQGGEFTVALGKACNVPPPVEWVPDRILVQVPKLDEGVWCEIDGKVVRDGVSRLPGRFSWAYAREGYVSKTNEHQLAVTDFPRYVLPRPDGKWVSADRPAPPPQSLKDALFNYDNEEFYDAVRCFAEAVKGGYRMTDDDLRKAKHAYNTTLKKLGVLIGNIEHDMALGRTPIRPLKDVQDERKNLLSWRRVIESAK